MPTHRSSLGPKINSDLALGNYRVLLINALSSFNTTTDLAQILQYECLQTVGGYAPQSFTYTPNTSTFDTGTGYQTTPDLTVNFSESISGDGYAHTHVLLWQGRGARANQLVDSINTSTYQITATAHLLIDGDQAFITSTGTLPDGLAIQRYYVKAVDLDTIEFYTDADLTNQVSISDSGTGTLYLRYATGYLDKYDTLTGTIEAGQTKPVIVTYERQ